MIEARNSQLSSCRFENLSNYGLLHCLTIIRFLPAFYRPSACATLPIHIVADVGKD